MDGHRCGARRILALEAAFKQCPHPDETQVANLSRETGMTPQQIKYWFQTRRAQIKASDPGIFIVGSLMLSFDNFGEADGG
uniref:Homeobox-leucine zipper protein HDG11 n=1 Tax=Aegilops tauschii TaxID=37682 RepID=M8C863_AEGTA